jgi:ribosomal protein L11 methyltransferase
MTRTFAALDLIWSREPDDDKVDLALAHLDDCGATAIERRPGGARLFFASERDRDQALTMTPPLDGVQATAVSVPDEGWAERSQASITDIRVGRIVVTPPWVSPATGPHDITIVIQPSMGFGTGHHASTRLCLALLQRLELDGRSVLDVGTGSGVLAIAAHRLGAATVHGIDYDADALTSAGENVELNHVDAGVAMRLVDLTRESATGGYDVLTANLTGGMLIKHAMRLVAELRSGGTIIVSGFQAAERDEVIAALATAGAVLADGIVEDDWVAAALTIPRAPTAR